MGVGILITFESVLLSIGAAGFCMHAYRVYTGDETIPETTIEIGANRWGKIKVITEVVFICILFLEKIFVTTFLFMTLPLILICIVTAYKSIQGHSSKFKQKSSG